VVRPVKPGDDTNGDRCQSPNVYRA
jgi:hypothetical protein